MQIQYVLTKAEWDDYHEANHILTKIKSILSTSGIYNHELSIPAMTMYLVAKNDELNASHKTLKEVTEQRDRLADLVKQFIYILDITEESDGGRLFHPTNITSCRAGDLQKAGQLVEALRRTVKGGSDDFDQFRPFDF